MAKHQFQTEVNQLLHLMIHSLYSNKEIFLRELISNASDALDKLKYLTITDDNYKNIEFKPKIVVFLDDKDNSITISDTGIGMNEQDLINHLGTIAKSGTRSFIESLGEDAKRNSDLIGQFGVGFYSAFMVADKIEVITKKAGEEKAYKWVSDASGEYEITEVTKETNGTVVYMKLKDDAKEFLNRYKTENIIKKYSDHIPFEIHLKSIAKEKEELSEEDKANNKEAKDIEVEKIEQVNQASALWTLSKSDLKESDYVDFYKTLSHDNNDPMHYVHTKAEGNLQYTTLFYIPKTAPMDMYRVDYQAGVKLYIKRVFITDDEKELLPTYLRFVRGIIDSEDLPLNVSREILQHNSILEKIKSASTKKILSEIKKLSNDKDKYAEFIKQYSRPLKEGLYQDFANKDLLLELVRFKSTKADGYTSLQEYIDRAKESQKAIYYITGQNEKMLRNSPLLESFKANDIEVLILDDELDEIVVPSLYQYKEKEFKSVNRTDTAKDLDTQEDETLKEEAKPIIEKIKNALGDDVKDVRVSSRLQDSPSCIVIDENDPTIQMQNMLRAMGQNIDEDSIKPILEINAKHDIVKKLATIEDSELIEDISKLLYEQALLAEGRVLKDAISFNQRLNKIINRAL